MAVFQPKPFGKYYLIEKLATGGMAEIYKAKTFGVDGFEKLLAIKRILPHCAADSEFITMLIDEAKLSVLLSHTNIVQVYDLGKVGDDYFISMEYIEGCNLRELLNRLQKKSKKVDIDLAIYMMSEVCKGLDYAHARKDINGTPLNLVHRDISPQNILLSYEGEVKIVDFGIAKAAMNSTTTKAGILKGKINYMSPEQALGLPINGKTDIYAAALVLYELITGKKLFQGETHLEILKKIQSTQLTEASFSEEVPEAVRSILAKALAYKQEDRYATAGDFQIDLTRYLYKQYYDFTPRKLSNLMKEIFSEEIEKNLKNEQQLQELDSEARALLERSDLQENIVHRDLTPPAGQQYSSPAATETFFGKRNTQSQIAGQSSQNPATYSTPAAYTPKKKSKTGVYISLFGGLALFFILIIFLTVGFIYRDSISGIFSSSGTIKITSNPSGAQVFVNDKDTQQKTPIELGKLELNKTYQIRLEKPGFEAWTYTANVNNTKTMQLNPKLNKITTGSINIITEPKGANIYLNDKDTGKVSPAKLEKLKLSQNYQVTLKMPGYQEIEEVIRIDSTKTIDLNKKLEKMTLASLRINSKPEGAKIYLDGVDTNLKTPEKLFDLELDREYSIKISYPGYKDFTKNIKLNNPETTLMSIDLQKVVKAKPRRTQPRRSNQQPNNPFYPSPGGSGGGGGGLYMP